MKRILIIDDDVIYQKMVGHAVRDLDFAIETANDGEQALQIAFTNPPDIITCDVMMPNVSGYEFVHRLRRDPRFAHTPILILTAQSELADKLEAFEAGADDYLTKPFEPAELAARLSVLLRRSESARLPQMQAMIQSASPKAQIVAVHSLRGGAGCSCMTINLGIALHQMGASSTLLMDLALTAGQIALMVNASLKRTWADLARVAPEELDWDVLRTVVGKHESGVHFIAAPTYPTEAEQLTPQLFEKAIWLFRCNFDHIVVDLPHDFSGFNLDVLDMADLIVMMLAPELASIRAAAAALYTYRELNYTPDKIKLVLNHNFESKGIPRKHIENALKHSIDLILPYTPELCVEAINSGRPMQQNRPHERISEAISGFAAQVAEK
jgi:pilus assembly protein CpaE